MLETRKVDNNKIRKVLFVNPRPLYVTDMCYLEPEVNVSFFIEFSGK